ncbi:MAG: zinc ribbon domain-containing protein [Desulfovibrionaceae bacterium]
MITLAEFERAGRIITGDRQRPQKRRSPWNGLLRCGECGCMITTEPPKVKVQQNGNRHVYHYVRCSKRSREVRCSQPYLRQSELEKQVGDLLKTIQVPRAVVDWAIEQLQQQQVEDRRTRASERVQIQKQLNLLDAKLATLTDKLVSGVITDQTYQISQAEYEQERSRLHLALERANQAGDDLRSKAKGLFDFANAASAAFREGDIETRRRILSCLGSNLRLKDRKLHVELHPCFRAFQKVKDSQPDKNRRFEPAKPRAQTRQRGGYGVACQLWCTLVDEVRTFLREDSGAALPVLDLTPQASSTSLLPREDDEEQGQNRNSHPALESQRSQA